MKISGSEQVTINASFDLTFVAAENNAIKETTEKLAREGKTVVNIIHGTPWKTPVATMKTLTFLWEGDDQHPLYLAAREQEKVAAERRRQEEAKKAAAEWERTRPQREKEARQAKIVEWQKKVSTLDERIARAKDEKSEEKDLRKYKTWALRAILGSLAILAAGIGISAIFVFIMWDSGTFFQLIVIIGILSVMGFAGTFAYFGFETAGERDKHFNLEERKVQLAKDRANLEQLEKQRDDLLKLIDQAQRG